jgi:hypothetical protein
MILSFYPVRVDDELSLERLGDVLIVNGEAFDLSGIPEGATLPRTAVSCRFLASDIERQDGQLRLTLILPHGPDAPLERRFPEPIIMTENGPIILPPETNPEETSE